MTRLTAAAALILCFCLGAVAQADSTTIQGGKGVGGVRLGQSLDDVTGSLGDPNRTTPSPNDPKSGLMEYPSLGLSVFMGSSGGVIGVVVTSPRYRTPDGVAVGSEQARVVRLYGPGLVRGPGNVVYPQRGLGFSFARGLVESIYVFKVEDERPLLEDRIILPGRRVGGIRLGDLVSKVADAWGKPDKAGPLAPGSDRQLHRYKEEAVELVVQDGRIEGVLVETGDFITREGVKVGSSRGEVLEAFGKSYRSQGERIWYPGLGIGFVFLRDRVIQIQVLEGGQ